MGEQGEARIPTEEEIRKLPRWAKVAFAARCARRVQPLFKHLWADAPREYLEAIHRAITLAEVSAGRPASASKEELDAAAAAAGAAARAAYAAAADAGGGAARVAYSAYAAAAYAAAAAAAAYAYAADAAAYAADAAADGAAIRRDFERLLELAKGGEGIEAWTDETPVPPEVFGPMWAEGAPEGWPSDGSTDAPVVHDDNEQRLVLRFPLLPIPPGNAGIRDLAERIADVIVSANALHQAKGGEGLEIEDGSLFVPEPVNVPVPDPEPAGGGLRP